MRYNIIPSFLFLLFTHRLLNPAEAILGGDKAPESNFTYHALIYRGFKDGAEQFCQGGIIADRYVLTAYTCFDRGILRDVNVNYPYAVVAGTHDVNAEDRVVRFVDRIYVSSRVNPMNNEVHDFAVLRLKEGLGLGANPKLSKLDLPPQNKTNNYVLEVGNLSSFGSDWVERNETTRELLDNGSSGILKFAAARVMSQAQCAKEVTEITVTQRHLCAKLLPRPDGEPRGTCVGDVGAPLVINNTVIGIQSRTAPFCDDSVPSLYTRITNFVSFIRNVINGIPKKRKQKIYYITASENGLGKSYKFLTSGRED